MPIRQSKLRPTNTPTVTQTRSTSKSRNSPVGSAPARSSPQTRSGKSKHGSTATAGSNGPPSPPHGTKSKCQKKTAASSKQKKPPPTGRSAKKKPIPTSSRLQKDSLGRFQTAGISKEGKFGDNTESQPGRLDEAEKVREEDENNSVQKKVVDSNTVQDSDDDVPFAVLDSTQEFGTTICEKDPEVGEEHDAEDAEMGSSEDNTGNVAQENTMRPKSGSGSGSQMRVNKLTCSKRTRDASGTEGTEDGKDVVVGSDDVDFQPSQPQIFKRRKTLREVHADLVSKKRHSKSTNSAHRADGRAAAVLPATFQRSEGVGDEVDLTPEYKPDVKPKVKPEIKPEVRMGVEDNKPMARITPKQAYVHIMQEFVPHVEIPFNFRSQARATSIAVFQLLEKSEVEGVLPIEGVSELIRSLLFVRRSEETLESAWTSEDGKLASQTRRRVMLCCLNMARRNAFGDFSDKRGDGKPLIPKWLTAKIREKNYLVAGHIKKSVDILETRTEPKHEYNRRALVARRGSPTRSDVGMYVFDYLYGSLKRMLSRTRRNARMAFFHKVGYLFMDWKAHPECLINETDVILRWAAPIGDSLEVMMKEGLLPTCEPYTKDLCREDECDKENNQSKYVHFGRAVDDVTLLVEHDVIIRKDTSAMMVRRRTGRNRRTWRKAINLIDVVRELIENACGFLPDIPAFDILRANTKSITLLYNMARTFRAMLSTLPQRKILESNNEQDCDGADEPVADVGNDQNAFVRRDSNSSDDHEREDDQRDGEVKEVHNDCVDSDSVGIRQSEVERPVKASGTKFQYRAGHDCGNGEEENGNPSGHSHQMKGDKGTRSVQEKEVEQSEDEDGSLDEEHVSDIAHAVSALFDVLMGDDVSTGYNLKQVTCTVSEQEYWAEHIGGNNESTDRYGHIQIGGSAELGEDEHYVADEEEEEEEDFGM